MYPTFAPVPEGMESFAAVRARREDMFCCTECGSFSFSMSRKTGEMKCLRCGNVPMDKEMRSIINRLNSSKAELESLKNLLMKKQRDLDSLCDQMDGVQERLHDLSSLEYKKNLEIKNLDESLKLKHRDLELLLEQIDKTQMSCRESETLEQQSRAEMTEVQGLLELKKARLAEINTRLAEEKQRLQILHDQRAAVNQRLDELLDQRFIMERKLSELNQQLSQKKLELDLLYTKEKAQKNRSEGTDSFSDAESMLEFLGVPRKPRIKAIAANHDVTVAAYTNGTVKVIGKVGFSWAAVGEWRNIVSVAVCDKHIFGLTNQGTVLCTGKGEIPRVISKWEDIIAISANRAGVFGLTQDGRVFAAKGGVKKKEVANWRDIKAISAGHDYVVGLRKDGTVIAAGRNDKGQCEVTNWEGITSISAGTVCTIGVKEDGSVVNTGQTEWTKSRFLSTHQNNYQDGEENDLNVMYGLREDRTVEGIRVYSSCEEETGKWTDIVDLVVVCGVVIGLKKDGTVVSTWAEHSPARDVSELNCGVV